MSRGVKIAVVVVVLAALGVLAYVEKQRADRAEAEAAARTAATTAMHDAKVAQGSFEDQLKSATTDVISASMISIPKAGAAITTSVLPIIDGYLAKLDRALLASAAYLAFHPDLPQATRDGLAALEKTSKQLHSFRDSLVKLADDVAKGTLTLDALAGQLASASLLMLN